MIARLPYSSPLPSAAPHRASRGLSLLEVILALAVLAMAIAAIGELVRSGARAASGSRDLTQAQLLCESIVAEISAGIAPVNPVQRAQCEFDPEWVYSVDLLPTDQDGLLSLYVLVEQAEPSARPLSYGLVRWIPDPSLGLSSSAGGYSDGTLDGGAGSGSTANGSAASSQGVSP